MQLNLTLTIDATPQLLRVLSDLTAAFQGAPTVAEAKPAPAPAPVPKPEPMPKPKAEPTPAAPAPTSVSTSEQFTDATFRASMSAQIDRIVSDAKGAVMRPKVIAELKRIAADVFGKAKPMDITEMDERKRFIEYLGSLAYSPTEARFTNEPPF